MTTNQNPGDVEIYNLNIAGVDFKDKLLSLTVTESISSSIVMAEATVIQIQGDQTNFKFDEKSTAQISFGHPSGQKRNYDLMVNSVKNVQAQENQTTRKFTIQMVSKHAGKSASTLNYQKAFKNVEASKIAETITKEGLQLSIPTEIDPTKGLFGTENNTYVLRQDAPLAHLNRIKDNSYGSEKGSSFMMFSAIGSSGNETFKFKDILNLVKQSPTETITNKTSHEMNKELNASMWNNAISIQYPEENNILNNARAQHVNPTNVDTHTATSTPLTIPRGSQRVSALPGTNSPSGSGYSSSSRPGTTAIATNSTRIPSDTRPQLSPYSQNLMTALNKGGVSVKIPGNSNIKVGDVVNFDFRENTDSFFNNDTKYYGKNIVKSVISFIGPLLDKPRYVSVIELTNIHSADGSIK